MVAPVRLVLSYAKLVKKGQRIVLVVKKECLLVTEYVLRIAGLINILMEEFALTVPPHALNAIEVRITVWIVKKERLPLRVNVFCNVQYLNFTMKR